MRPALEHVGGSPAEPFAAAAVSDEAVQPQSRKAVVLVIDDDRALSSLLSVIFRGAGYRVATARDGEDGLARLETEQPDAIVLDLEMPRMDGRTFYHHLRDRGSRVPVLILSAYGARNGQRELGAQAYMDKPFDPEALLAAVEALLPGRQPGS